MMRAVFLTLLLLLGQGASAQVSTAEKERLLRDREAQEELARATGEAPGIAIDGAAQSTAPEVFCFDIANIDVEGVESLRPKDVEAVISPYVDSCMGQVAVDNVLQALTQAYLDKGLVTSRAYLPEQDLETGRLLIVVVEGVIEDVVLAEVIDDEGNVRPGPKHRFSTAFPTKVGDLLNLRRLEQGVDQLNRLRSVQSSLDIAPGQGVGGSIINLAYRVTDPTRLTFGYNHTSTHLSTSQTASLNFEQDNLIGINDTLFLGLSGGEISNALAGSWSFPKGFYTGTLSFNYSESNSQLTATTELFEQNLSYTIANDWLVHRDDKSKTRLTLDIARSHNDRFVNATALTAQDFATLSLGIRRERYFETAYLGWSLDAKVGRLTSDASGITPGVGPQVDFRVLSGSITYQKQWQSRTSLLVSLNAQHSDRPLFSAHQFTLGGTSSLRGVAGNQVNGDSAFSLAMELGIPMPQAVGETHWANLRPYGFLEAGHAVNRTAGTTHSAMGIGVGARYFLNDTASLDFYYGKPVYAAGGLDTSGYELGLKLSVKVF